MVDVDQGGQFSQKARVYLGPSLGWVEQRVRPEVYITIAQTYQMLPGDSVVMVNVAGNVTVNLPDVQAWLRENAAMPMTGFERAIWIKDLGGNAQLFPITVVQFSGQRIDSLLTNYTIISNRALLRLYPIYDLSGWFAG